jgi:hypothetical protein
MSDPERVAVAAALAHALLTESHQPLLMTPGDVRALLARTQRRLQDLADAVEPMTPVALTAQADTTASALSSLRARWQGAYVITLRRDGAWTASPHSDRSVLLTARSPGELRTAMQNYPWTGWANRRQT